MVRKSYLAGSWYPAEAAAIEKLLESWTEDIKRDESASSGIIPHAGWFYSGKISAQIVKTVCSDADLIIIAGGHLAPGSDILAAGEDAIETPFGVKINRTDIIGELGKLQHIRADNYQDNTVEVVVPMAAYFAPAAELVWVRLPADQKSIKFAENIYRLSSDEDKKTVFLGSTDLTHYGRNYYFEPAGKGSEGLKWMKTINDAAIIDKLTSMQVTEAIETAVNEKSACSIGAAAAAARFGQLCGAECGNLLEYTTSYDIQPAESFVGYAGIYYGC